eukprot:2370397-Amphidinium_carterae.1
MKLSTDLMVCNLGTRSETSHALSIWFPLHLVIELLVSVHIDERMSSKRKGLGKKKNSTGACQRTPAEYCYGIQYNVAKTTSLSFRFELELFAAFGL